MQRQHLILGDFAIQSESQLFKTLGGALGAMTVLVVLGGWRAYCVFQSFFELKGSEIGLLSNEIWLFAGPVSLFVATFLGIIVGMFGYAAKHLTSRKFWSILLWVLFVWLTAGATAFTWLDYSGNGPKSSLIGHIWNSLTIALPMACGAACLFNIIVLLRARKPSTLVTPPSPWRRITAMVARIILWTGALFGSTLAAFTSAILLLAASCSPPSLPTLGGRFAQQRRDLEILVQMADQDSDFYVIDPEWLESSAGQFREEPQAHVALSPFVRKNPGLDPLHDPEAFMTIERWNEYRRIFSRNHITQGIRRSPTSGDAFILVKSDGLVTGGSSSGYIHCGPGPEHTYPPCSSKELRFEQPNMTAEHEAYSFLKLADRWYAYNNAWD